MKPRALMPYGRVKAPPRASSVFVVPSGWHLVVEWVGLGGTLFYVRCLSKLHAETTFDSLIDLPDVAGISLYHGKKFLGARDGAGS